MEKTKTLEALLENDIFAVVRMTDSSKLLNVVSALCDGGIKNIEITLTVPNAAEMISSVRSRFSSEIIVGAGTVTSAEEAESVIKNGAQFIVSPILNPDVIAVCKKNEIPVAAGCYTPTEIFAGWKAGADIVKVFPATSLGPSYFKDISAVFPQIKLMPTGGVSIDNVGEWFKAGASAVALGSNLLDKKAIAESKFEIITETAKRLMNNLNIARQNLK